MSTDLTKLANKSPCNDETTKRAIIARMVLDDVMSVLSKHGRGLSPEFVGETVALAVLHSVSDPEWSERLISEDGREELGAENYARNAIEGRSDFVAYDPWAEEFNVSLIWGNPTLCGVLTDLDDRVVEAGPVRIERARDAVTTEPNKSFLAEALGDRRPEDPDAACPGVVMPDSGAHE